MPDSDGSQKLNVPKFSSFKAKVPASDSSALVLAENADARKERRAHRHRSPRHDEKPRHRHSRRGDSEREREDRSRIQSRDDQALVKVEVKPKPEPEDDGGERLFVLDKRGDPLISRYHSNDRSQVPLYRRAGRGRVLGSEGFLVIHREGNRDEFSIRLPGEGPSLLRDRRLFSSSIGRKKPKRVKVGKDDATGDVQEEFVPLSTSKGKPQHDRESQLPQDEGPDYRSVEGKAKAHELSDSDLEYDTSDENGAGLDSDEPVKQRSIELSRRVKEHPTDIAGWLELIRHQDVLLHAGEGIDSEATQAETRSYAEIKLSLYESALQRVPTSSQDEILLLGLVLEGQKVWPAEKLQRRWDDAVKKHPNMFALWKTRLDYELSKASTFQYQQLKEMHLTRLGQVRNEGDHPILPNAGSPASTGLEPLFEQRIYIFLRTTRYVFDAGYRELAVAAWQALLELNLNRPSSLHGKPESEVLEAFEEFWESEAPRLGDEGALGWAHYSQSGGAADFPQPRVDDKAVSASRDIFRSWGLTELQRALGARRPARVMDEGTEDDPYRVVMFSDIAEFLFVVPPDVLSQISMALSDAFLLFCHLPLALGTSEWMKVAATDPHVVGHLKKLEKEVSEKNSNAHSTEGDSSRPPDFPHDAIQMAASLDVLFSGLNWFQYLAGWPTVEGRDGGPVELSLAVEVIRQLVQIANIEALAAYSLALGWVHDRGVVKKRARTLLKQFPTNRGLYTAYALAEWANGNIELARQVFSSAASLPESGINSPDQQPLLLWTARAWLELEQGDKTKAALCLCASVDSSVATSLLEATNPTPHQLLNTQQTLSSTVGYSVSSSDHPKAVLNAEALVLFEYLTAQRGAESASVSQGNIKAAMDRLWAVSRDLENHRGTNWWGHEKLLQAGARLLYLHASRGPFRSAFLREQLTICLGYYPQNTMFLALFVWASPNFGGIEDPARELLRDAGAVADDGKDCLGTRVLAIRYELRRGNHHTTRAAFERALNSRTASGCAELWRCYVRFAYVRKELRDKAKEVFWRGLGRCPWSKELAMEAFTTLVNVMDEYELRSVFGAMVDRGLRVHLELEDFVNTRKLQQSR